MLYVGTARDLPLAVDDKTEEERLSESIVVDTCGSDDLLTADKTSMFEPKTNKKDEATSLFGPRTKTRLWPSYTKNTVTDFGPRARFAVITATAAAAATTKRQ